MPSISDIMWTNEDPKVPTAAKPRSCYQTNRTGMKIRNFKIPKLQKVSEDFAINKKKIPL